MSVRLSYAENSHIYFILCHQHRFTVTYFALGVGANESSGYDGDCVSSVPSPGRSEDHLLIPGAEIWRSPFVLRVDKFCGRSLMSAMVTSNIPGPFVMYFKSDEINEGNSKPEIGFRIHYEFFWTLQLLLILFFLRCVQDWLTLYLYNKVVSIFSSILYYLSLASMFTSVSCRVTKLSP